MIDGRARRAGAAILAWAGDRSPATRRGIALALTILVHLLMLLAVLLQRGIIVPRDDSGGLKTFALPAPGEKTAAAAKTRQKSAERRTESHKEAEKETRPPTPRPPVTVPLPSEVKAPSFIPMSRDEFASADLARRPQQGPSLGNGSGSAGGGGGQMSGPGQGPGGVQLYEAQWYRRPTHAELDGYLPADPSREGWGLVACRTIADYQVDNCQTLGESPVGSGFARAVRQAAWQFRVIPPRVDGKAMIGAWVRIRIDYTQLAAQ
jgi:protein TonB